MAVHDPTREVQRFDEYRAALRDAVQSGTKSGTRSRMLKVQPLRRRTATKNRES